MSVRNQESYISIPVIRDRRASNLRKDSFLNGSIGSFKGVNSLGRFASSFNRAQSFRNIEPIHGNPRSYFKDDDELYDPQTLSPSRYGDRLSSVIPKTDIEFLRNRNSNENINQIDEPGDYDAIDDSSFLAQSIRDSHSIYSYGATTTANDLGNGGFAEFSETEPLVLKKIETNSGKTVTVIAGQSTAPQTIFNSVNVLIGIGLLALPLGLKYAGWVIGVPALSMCALLTFYSADLLSKCMDTDPTLMTYSDLAYVTFGPNGRSFISFLFSLDLIASGVSLIVLFADSLNALYPSIPINHFKIIAFLVLTPPSFLPLNVLSLISLFGITSTIGVVVMIFIAGFTKTESPGSLIQFAPTNLFPDSLASALISIGILMAPFGGHAIFPNLKVDMRHPYKFKDCLKTTYGVTYLTDMSMAVIGFLMFGGNVKEEITKSILLTEGYFKWTYILICTLMAIVPFSKLPLNARPIISIFDHMFNVHDISISSSTGNSNASYFIKSSFKVFIRLFVNALFVIIAILFPEFDKIIAFMGAGLCFALCLIFPCLFYLSICKDSISSREKIGCYTIIIASSILSAVGITAAIIY
ncbi:Vacuolar amino acid transporter 1 [Wickerhamomyces ciferrii]|uniref:Vacuolar amino acid transporter 1 n=1 Tax=Wickerhamomyces ciferrii (strain ATCC 14091 / BCRC 22168 / CBS 111 / JCM 3599 / NBRC 0793 / NRRL Y-1031 F-60-10) TaxID=1206466 RepID=K0KRI6_WICCF|nr:Vacuolar amino acid transporter 1 [Wickerhamomyces ciferrii]CCH44662.1 Vacuolar amino acid transporter 1 [Wickerhamomyces ciferrii]